MAWTIGLGLLANAGGSAFDAYLVSEAATGWVRWVGTTRLGFCIAYAAVVLALAGIEWHRMQRSA